MVPLETLRDELVHTARRLGATPWPGGTELPDEYRRTPDGWRIVSRTTTFMRRNGSFDHGKAHDPARYVAGQAIE